MEILSLSHKYAKKVIPQILKSVTGFYVNSDFDEVDLEFERPEDLMFASRVLDSILVRERR